MNAGTILGISLGTRLIGIAIIKDGHLLHSQVQSFHGLWSHKKLREISHLIDRVINKYDMIEIRVKIPDVLPNSKGFNQLIGSVNRLCEGHVVQYYHLSEIIAMHCHTEKATRKNLLDHIVKIFPELILEYRREQKNKNAYYYKVFEAVAAALM